MATWDVFHSDRLEVERSLTTQAVREALARGDLHDDDLARPAGTTIPWARLADVPELMARTPEPSEATPTAEPEEPGSVEAQAVGGAAAEEEPIEEEPAEPISPAAPPRLTDIRASTTEDLNPPELRDQADDLGEFDLNLDEDSRVALPAVDDAGDDLALAEPEDGEVFDPQEEDEAAAEFTLSRSAAGRVEELDLAAMVDVAFQMVLFFMVTATTVLYKTLEVPRTPPQDAPGAVAQGAQRKSLDDMRNDFIVVEISPAGEIRVDNEAASADTLVSRLRKARSDTGRNAMLLSADMTTPHRNAVLAYDAANEIGLSIAIAKPNASGAPPPAAEARKSGTG